ncbi:MAG TPA: hypothetical protein VF984_09775 [Actinomycetota bacterium]
MNAERGAGWARGIGFVLGVTLAVTAVFGWRLPRGTGRLGADVVIGFLQTGELHLSDTTPLITASGLQPGASGEGSVEVRNISGSRLGVAVDAQPSIADLDRLLWIEVTAGGTRIFQGPIGELRDGSIQRFAIAPSQTETVDVRTWIPTSAGGGYEGRIEQVNLTFDPKVSQP